MSRHAAVSDSTLPLATVITTRGTTNMTARLVQSGARASAIHGRTVAAVSARGAQLVLASVAAVLLMVVALPATASAAQTRNEVSSFGGGDSDAGAFSGLGRLAVHQASGTVYAIDAGAAVVDKFDSSGAAQDFSALGSSSLDGTAVTAPDGPVNFSLGADSDLAVDNSGTASDGNLVVLTEGQQTAWVFDSAGNYLHQITGFGDPCGAAVDSAGNTWIADYVSRTVTEYTAAGIATGTAVDTSAEGHPCHIAFDSADNLYVALYNGALHKYDAAGAHVAEIDPGFTYAVAVDPVSGHVLAAHTDHVSEYDASGGFVLDFGGSTLAGAVGVAFVGSADTAYVADQAGNHVMAFGAAEERKATIAAESVSGVGLTDATVRAQINPGGNSTTYHIDYGTDITYGQSTPESTPIGADQADHPVNTKLTGLAPGTRYHWRVVANNTVATVTGSDHTFMTQAAPVFGACPNDALRTGAGGRLPDCRAYEQVSPAEKGGTALSPAYGSTRATAAGDAFTFGSSGGLRGIGGFLGLDSSYVGRRNGSGSGWSTVNQLSNVSQPWEQGFAFGWSDDLSKTVALSRIDGEKQLMLIDLVNDAYQVVGHLPSYHSTSLADFSADGSRMIFESDAQLLPEAAVGVNNLYAWDANAQSLSLAGVLPDGSTPPDGATAGPPTDPLSYNRFAYKQNTISDDGSKAFFTAGGQLYVRKNLATGGATTDWVSASQKTNGSGPGGTDPLGPQPVTFMAATPSGSKVLFTSSEKLTDDANTGASDEGRDLYSYDVASGELTDLTVDDDPNGADVQGVLGASDDGSTVFFAANGVLAAGGTQGNCVGPLQDVHCGLYVRRDGVTHFIATIGAGNDAFNWSPVAVNSRERRSRVTPDGNTLLFMSAAEGLTDYDNAGQTEVYRYDAMAQQLLCVSCDPSGAAPTGQSALQSLFVSDLSSGGWYPSNLSRNLSSSGDRVFFESPDSLVAGDTNGVQDVYQWEAEGSGSCRSARENGGCLYLLSTGRGGAASKFGDASSSGDDVFILTDDRLVGQDGDGAVDVYDVRVGGGIAGQNPPASSPPCSGDGCRASATAPPVAAVPASVTFDGAGNVPGRREPLVARVSVPKKAVKGPSFLLRARLPAAGVVRASGGSIKSVRRTLGKAGSLRLRITLTARAKSRLKQRKRLALKFKVAFKPRSGPQSTASVSLTVKA